MNIRAYSKLMKDRPVPEAFAAWLEKAGDRDLLRLNPKVLGQQLSLQWKPLFEDFLYGIKLGAWQLNWEYHCPHCNGVTDFQHNLRDLPSESGCPLCDVEFRGTLDKNIEVTFTPHPNLYEIPAQVLEAVRNEAIALVKSGGKFPAPDFLSGLECLNSPLFRELFGEDVLSSEESLQIGQVTILFTDIKGSTEMYSKLGDATSYRIVREHFKILFRAVEDNGGVVVKTIGDAVMASFLKPAPAVKAALAAYDEFKKRKWDPVGNLEIKMGLHTGGVIAVTMNDRIDYFGNTVNTAARIQGLADNHTVCLSGEVMSNPGVKKVLAHWTAQNPERVYHSKVQLRGIAGEVDFYRLAVRE